MNFREAESYLLSLGNEVETMKLGLDNIRKLLAALGNPQNNYLKVQVAGTNGKGSVCAFLDSICLQAGIKTGVFTSPHLVSVTERVRIDGVDIAEDDFARHSTLVRETAERMVTDGQLEYTPTFFEQVTAIALIAFADANVELAILETGLGGRLDATTAANAEVAAITRIDIDHQEYLGETIEEIAAEKAAIIGQRTEAVVVASQPSEAMEIIINACERFGSTLVVADDVNCSPFKLGLAGKHQVENAQVAMRVAEILRKHFAIRENDIAAGLENAHHAGRLELQGSWLFDGAHNVGGARALREFLNRSDRPVTLVFGVMKGKNVGGMAEQLFPRAWNILIARIDNPRSMEPEHILTACDRKLWRDKVVDIAAGNEIVEKAKELKRPEGLIVVTGSLYLIGEVKKLLISQI